MLHLIQQGIDLSILAIFNAADQQDLLIDVIEHDHDTRHDQQGLGHVQHVRLGDLHRLDILDHVITDIAERAGRHGRQGLVSRGAGVAHKRLQCGDGVAILRFGIRERGIAGDLCRAIQDAEPAVRFQPDKGIAAQTFAARNGLEQKAAGRLVAELQHGCNGCFNIPDAPPDDQFCLTHWSVEIVAL